MSPLYFSIFAAILALTLYTPNVKAVVSNLVVGQRTTSSIMATWTIDNVNSTNVVTFAVGSTSVAISIPKNTGTVTGLTVCTLYVLNVTEASSPVSTVTGSARTRPETPVLTSVNAGSDGMVTFVVQAPAVAPSTSCPFWAELTLRMGTTVITEVVSVPVGSFVFYDVPAGNYSASAVYVTPNDFSADSTAVTVIVPSWTTTTTTTAATTTAVGGQFVVSVVGKLLTPAGELARYRSGYGVVGSPAFTSAATAICTSFTDIVSGNSTLKAALEKCFVFKFTNGSVIGDVRGAFTASKLTAFTNTSIETLVKSLVMTTTQTGDLRFQNTTSGVTVTVTGYYSSANQFAPLMLTYLCVMLSILAGRKLYAC